jgi:hypothetical protein
MMRACFVSLFLCLTTTFLLSQSKSCSSHQPTTRAGCRCTGRAGIHTDGEWNRVCVGISGGEAGSRRKLNPDGLISE